LVHDEIEEAYEWYECRLLGLGSDFLDEVDRVLRIIADTPARYGLAVSGIREGLLKRFPYAVYYRELDDGIRN